MDEKLASIQAKFDELTRQMADENLANDYERYAEVAKQHNDLKPIVEKYQSRQKAIQEFKDAQEMAASGDAELGAMAQDEIARLEKSIPQMDAELKAMLLPKDPRDDRNVIVEIRAGAGGDEAGLFAAELWRLYARYAETHRYKVELMDVTETGVGGIKEVVFNIKGKGAYSKLKWESGVHRVQRIPATESNGRIHTSTVTVAMMPEVEEVEISIPERDIEVESFRSQGAGGQNVQKNETAIRIKHLPTGLIVQCQDERSQLQNRLRAMSILRARLYDMQMQKQQAEMATMKRDQIGTGDRSEKIRTYNFPQSRVTDHRIEMSLYKIDAVMNGEIDDFIDELTARDIAQRLEAT
jgi:peptide chain release factor 1